MGSRTKASLIAGIIGIFFGTMVSIIISGNQTPINGLVNTTPYQNFGVLIGAMVGFPIGITAFLLFWYITQKAGYSNLSRWGAIVCGVLGGLIWVLVYSVLSGFAENYGMVVRGNQIVLIDGLISFLAGIILGGAVGWFLPRLRIHQI